MSSLLRSATATLAALLLTTTARADLAQVAKLKAGESIVVSVIFIGTVPITTRYTFTPDKVSIEESNKPIGEVTLNAEDKKSVDRYLDLVRDGRRASRSGNGTSTYWLTLFRKGRAVRSFEEEISIRSAADEANAQGKVLSLPELRKRAAKK